MKLAHCSDLHLLSHQGAKWFQFANKRWLGAMNLLSNRSRHYHTEAFVDMVADINAQGVDHVLCTGDVTNLAFRQEFEFARQRFDGFTLPTSSITVLPGNHDAYVPEGVAHFAEVFAPFITSTHGYQPSPSPAGVTAGPAAEAAAANWPLVRIAGHVAIVGLCTSQATPWFTAHGTIGRAQLLRVDEVLTNLRRQGLRVVVGLHHPPAGRRAANRIRGLRDAAAFAAVVARHEVALILHGHEHRDLREVLPGSGAPVPVLGVPSGTYGATDPTRTARYRLIEIGADGEIRHRLRVWHRTRRCFEYDDHFSA
ncbi:MAG: metallophosphoesterase [Myxococcales bacterium]|nr:metallophosphoesterase [Myxococcales bacterium]